MKCGKNNRRPHDLLRNSDFKTLSSTIYQTLRDEILDGRLKPKERLVRRKLAKRLNVSPIPVTEALWRLEQDGLVESEPMYGSRVKEINAEMIQNELVLRVAIECQAARLCARNASKREFEILEEKAADLDELVESKGHESIEGNRLHLKFHLSVAQFSGYFILKRELERAGFLELMRINWINATVVDPPPKRWHAQLVDALKTRDAELAEKKMREHVRYGENYLTKALKKWESEREAFSL